MKDRFQKNATRIVSFANDPSGKANRVFWNSILNRVLLIVAVVCSVGVTFQRACAQDQRACAQGTSQPNILLILTDDQGWSTLGCYGGKIVPTPHLDRLAADGARFTSAYVTSQCTPTRATLLSGQYTARNRMWHVIGWYGCPWAPVTERPFREQFPRGKPTIASELKRAGYATGIVGKWHLTNNADGHYLGLHNESSHHYGFDYAGPITSQEEFQEGRDRGVTTLTNQALEFISDHREQPWFCFLSHHMIHGKVVAPTELADKYRQQGYGAHGPNRAVYLAGLETIDRSVGTIIDRLEEMGELNETVIIFLSDNGGIDFRLAHRSLEKPHPTAPILEPDQLEYDNAPLRAGKGSIYEGGTRVPLIIRWPSVVKPGTVIDQTVHAIDLAPTLFQIAGHTPSDLLGLDGVDLTNVLRTGNDDSLIDRPVFQYCPLYDLNWGLTPCASIRQGKYKLIEFFGDRFDEVHQYVPGHHVELYDLSKDLGETQNLAIDQGNIDHRDITEAMLSRLHEWMGDMEVKPSQLNPHHEPGRAFETTRDKPNWMID